MSVVLSNYYLSKQRKEFELLLYFIGYMYNVNRRHRFFFLYLFFHEHCKVAVYFGLLYTALFVEYAIRRSISEGCSSFSITSEQLTVVAILTVQASLTRRDVHIPSSVSAHKNDNTSNSAISMFKLKITCNWPQFKR